jgi:hypothetical protein
MGWRFRRSIKIAPGIRWNISKSGTSWSIGRRGFTVNVSRRGVRRTVGIPGTGLSHSQMVSTSRSSRPAARSIQGAVSDARLSIPPPILFADPSSISPLTDEAAIAAARSWAAGRFPWLGRSLPACTTGVHQEQVDRAEAAYTVRTRRVVVSTEPLVRKVKPIRTIPDPSLYDPWALDIEDQIESTKTVATCHVCEGEGKHTCRTCDGSMEVVCDACAGSGSIISERTFNTVTCRRCGGDGRRSCPCRDGIVTCDTCKGKTVVTAWLAVEDTVRQEERKTGEPDFLSAPADRLIAANVEKVIEVTSPPEELPDEARALIGEDALRYAPDPRTERVEQVSIRQERSRVSTVDFRLAGHEGSVSVRAWDGRIQASENAARPFRTVKNRVATVGVLSLLAGFVLVAWFTTRHSYYQTSPQAAAMAVLVLVLPFLLIPPMIYSARPQRKAGVLLATALPTLLVLASQGVLATMQPSTTRARALAAAGNLEHAKREALATVELGRDEDGQAQTLYDKLQLQSFAAIKDPSTLWSKLSQARFLTTAARRQAENVAVERSASAAFDLQAKGNQRQSLLILAGVPAAFRDAPSIRQRRLSAQAEEAAGFWRTIRSKAPLAERLTACNSVKASVKELVSGQLPAATEVIEKTCLSITAEEARRVRREVEAVKLAERRKETEAQAWASAPLLCGDGTLSPSCVCGGSRRGCCSRHGGVAGCSR